MRTKERGHKITAIEPGSIAEELELEPGDLVVTINGHEIEDIFDYEYYVDSPSMLMVVNKANGEEWELDIEHDYEDLGITFENGLMSEYRSCSNQCIFCFIDQMPPGMRETLYFKDDDSRLSFLQGNYITLTNMKKKDIDRIIRFHLSPINISVHTTNPDLRCSMLHNRFAGQVLAMIDRLWEAKTPMNGQIVLCKGINDGEELERTIRDLTKYIPYMESVSVVPVGLTKFREGLFPLEPFTGEDARKVISQIEQWQKRLYPEFGTHFIHASDEFYLLAGLPLPEADRYDGYLQLENGVGMLRLFQEEILDALNKAESYQTHETDRDDKCEIEEEISIATGFSAYESLKTYIGWVSERFPNRKIHLYPIKNEFFGHQITVTGLLTGQDLMKQLKGKTLGTRLLLSANMFRSGEDVLLDDITKADLENALQVPVNIVKSSGYDFINALLFPVTDNDSKHQEYEVPDEG
ncbi:MAG: DUF512 domain-containing protein [Lachnospiraceae bacterium]|jgi:putative radical SAM enzyme (TIGR03279 family)|nr:DUF512 domain-containing protein [Lachnospiraceae bacterium]